jgi:DNA-binding protein H-NS
MILVGGDWTVVFRFGINNIPFRITPLRACACGGRNPQGIGRLINPAGKLMITNLQRREEIKQLRSKLQADVAELEQKYRADVAALNKQCKEDVDRLEREIKAYQAQEIRIAQKHIQEVIERSGLDAATVYASLAEDMPRQRAPMKPSTILHKGPDGQVWNGRGRKPHWFARQMEAQKALQHG